MGAAAEDGGNVVVVDVEAVLVEADAGVAGGVGQASPVGVGAVPGGFDEEGVADGAGDFFGVGFGLAAFDDEFDEFGHFFAVADDLFGERVTDFVDGFAEGLEQGGGGFRGEAGAAVGEEQDGIVRAHVAVDGDPVEGPVAGGGEGVFEDLVGGVEVGREEGEHGGHVGLDHAGSLGHARDGQGVAFVLEACGDDFAAGVGGEDGVGGGEGGLGAVREVTHGGVDPLADIRHGQDAADPTGRADEEAVFGLGGLLRESCHGAGVGHALFAGAGVGVAAVGDEAGDLGAAAGEEFLAEPDGRGADIVLGEHARHRAGRHGVDDREVEPFLAGLADVAGDAG